MHVEGVPNPNAMKFVLENGILTDQPYEYTDFGQTQSSPLARKLLALRYVDRVLLNANYVTIVKTSGAESPEWNKIIPNIRSMIRTHLEANEPILYMGATQLSHKKGDDVVLDLVEKILNKHIRGAAQTDGGDIVVESFADGVLNLQMHGACSGCPYASETIKKGVEPLMTQMIPEVSKVIAKENHVH